MCVCARARAFVLARVVERGGGVTRCFVGLFSFTETWEVYLRGGGRRT